MANSEQIMRFKRSKSIFAASALLAFSITGVHAQEEAVEESYRVAEEFLRALPTDVGEDAPGLDISEQASE